MLKTNKIWDAIVIGGGPAGMMAAGRAAERGRSVLLLEKNNILGKKLLITGGGRCNLTNNQPTTRAMIARYKGNPQFLWPAFAQFGIEETINFFNNRGMPTKVEVEERVFPVSNKARSVWEVLVKYMAGGRVQIKTGAAVADLFFDKTSEHFIIRFKDKTEVRARACVVATGGSARPETGSSGDGLAWLKKLGHTITANNFALVPITLKDSWVKKLSGVTLRDIKLTITQNGAVIDASAGKLLFTHLGISGPTILNMSRLIGELLPQGEVIIKLNLAPHLDFNGLKLALQTLLVNESNKKLKNTLGRLIPLALAPIVLELSGVDGETFNHSVRQDDRKKIVVWCQSIPLHVKGLLGKNKAVVSSGGVAPAEINFKTMQSRLIPNLYIIGDVLDIDRPSGGYSLQLSWTTGYVAGENV